MNDHFKDKNNDKNKDKDKDKDKGKGKSILSGLETAGYRAAFLPYAYTERIAKIYDALFENSENTQFIQGAVDRFHEHNYHHKPDLPFEPLSYLVAAFPSDPAQVILHTEKGRQAVPIPPTYLDYIEERRRLVDIIKSCADDCQTVYTEGISHKLLAVCSGLGRFGRNNICYIDGLGSYFDLHAFYTNIPYEGEFYPPAFLDECETCGLCEKNCPTGAIGRHPVIDAARCLTMLNESGDPMPDWLPQNVHHTLIGCLRCQEACPRNTALPPKTMHTLELDAGETQALISADTGSLPPELSQKLHAFGMHDYFVSVIGRNAKLALHDHAT